MPDTILKIKDIPFASELQGNGYRDEKREEKHHRNKREDDVEEAFEGTVEGHSWKVVKLWRRV